MRISDWSSDVGSSDLVHVRPRAEGCARHRPGARKALLRFGKYRAPRQDMVQARRGPPESVPLCERRSRKGAARSEEHTSELQSLMRISYAVFCLKKKQDTPTCTFYIYIYFNISL